MGFKDCRIRSGLTVAKSAEALSVSQEAVFCWERGQYLPEAKRLPQIAELYGCTVDELLNPDQDSA